MAFSGFPRRFRSIPVPNPVFGPLLEQIDDLVELKCTLRVIWLLHQKRSYPRFVTLNELLADRTLSRSLDDNGSPSSKKIECGLARAVRRGTLVAGSVKRDGEPQPLYMLNTESNRDAIAKIVDGSVYVGSMPRPEPWEEATERPGIFALYEDNIAMLTPMIADQLREAEELYPAAWIEEAFREAVSNNKRSWRYIASILQRWEREGRSDGEPGRRPKKDGYY